MKNFNYNLDKLNFHDSFIQAVNLNEDGVLKVNFHYYNWEGNERTTQKWVTKNMMLIVEHCIHLKFSSPGLWINDQEIQKHESLEKHSEIITQINAYQENRKSDYLNTVSVRFLTHSYGESVLGETVGFLEIAGLNASMTWAENDIVESPIHIT